MMALLFWLLVAYGFLITYLAISGDEPEPTGEANIAPALSDALIKEVDRKAHF